MVSKIELEKLIKNYGRITKRVVDGVKTLPYPIHSHERGLYLYYKLEIDRNKVSELSGTLNINDNVVRFLMVQAGKERVRYDN